MRIAIKVAYDGTRFHGNQVQPDARTVHAELARALRDMGHVQPDVKWAGRTDAGVSAAGNVAVFETLLAPASLLPGLSYRMEDAVAWAWSEVGAGFEPRHAKRRRYRYLLRTPSEADALASALKLFEGEHDFTAFCRLEEGVNPVRTVERTAARREGAFVVIDVEGPSFLWNQVRRMVSAAERVSDGRAREEDVRAALATGAAGNFGTAPPEPLLLLDVQYDGLAFQRVADPQHVTARLARRIADEERALAVLRAMRDAAEGR